MAESQRHKAVRSIEWTGKSLRLLDQTKLPTECTVIDCLDHKAAADAIRSMKVRGAPAIGATAAYGIALGALELSERPKDEFVSGLKVVADLLGQTRPTAVNLFWAIKRMMAVLDNRPEATVSELVHSLIAEAEGIANEDVEICKKIGDNGAELIHPGDGVLTHCNTGALATVDYGTALGVIRSAHAQGKNIHVYADETRPYLQGARLTAWELVQEGIPATLITDSMAGWLMKQGKIQAAIVGADRIAANGDTANKIGTYSVAILCKEHGIPFYVAAPLSTIDLSIASGEEIPIEERPAEEVTHVYQRRIAPEGVEVANPAFDVTPAEYISAIITEVGVVTAPFGDSLSGLFHADGLKGRE